MRQRNFLSGLMLVAFVFSSALRGGQQTGSSAPGSISRLLSDDTLVLVEVADVGKLVEQLKASPFGASVRQAQSLKPALAVATAASELAAASLLAIVIRPKGCRPIAPTLP